MALWGYPLAAMPCLCRPVVALPCPVIPRPALPPVVAPCGPVRLGHSPKENPRRLGQGLGQVRLWGPGLSDIELPPGKGCPVGVTQYRYVAPVMEFQPLAIAALWGGLH